MDFTKDAEKMYIFMSGAFDLSVPDTYSFSIPEFQEEYRKNLALIRKISSPCLFEGEAYFGFFDIGEEELIQGFFPDSKK